MTSPHGPTLTRKCDVVVAGGGPAGIAAAVGAARLGVQTVLIERYGFLGGCATACLVSPFMTWRAGNTELVRGVFAEMRERMEKAAGLKGSAFDAEAFKICADELLEEAGVRVLLHTLATGVRKQGKSVCGLDAWCKGGMGQADAKVAIDCTGDGDVAAMAGVPVDLGDPAEGHGQAMTTMFHMRGVDIRATLWYCREHPEQMLFPKPSKDVDLEGVLASNLGIAGFYDLVRHAKAAGEFPEERDFAFFLTLPADDGVTVNTTCVGGRSALEPDSLSEAERAGRRQAWQVAQFLCKYVPGFENARLGQTAPQIGVRVSRRIVGEYVFSAEDVAQGRKHPDAIAHGCYYVDIHTPGGRVTHPTKPPEGDWYDVPYRCLVPLEVEQLLVAGRCVSATLEGQGALRIMPTCFAMGQAAGVAAALAARSGVAPRAINAAEIQACLRAQGAVALAACGSG